MPLIAFDCKGLSAARRQRKEAAGGGRRIDPSLRPFAAWIAATSFRVADDPSGSNLKPRVKSVR
jgi:hypothetical protein